MLLRDAQPLRSDANRQEGGIPHILHHIRLGQPEEASHGSEAEAEEASQEKVDSCRHHHR